MAVHTHKINLPIIKTGADCCGCTGCASICPTNAITMEADEAGFVYPKLNPIRCIGCKLCEKVCAFETRPARSSTVFPKFYGARQKSLDEVMKSRSGGIFPVIAKKFLQDDGVIYGVTLTEEFRVIHKRINSTKNLDELRGSKYVQSDLTGIFRNVKDDLQNGRKVLFSGTPCQTSTLLKYIPEKLHANLFVIDVVCHGVPGPIYWKEYLNFIEKKYKKKIIKYNFRDKERFNWLRHQETVIFEGELNPTVVKYRFYSDVLFRKSCSNCPFTSLNRPSDLTLADFWGYERTGTHLNDDKKGLSLILVNSNKGSELFDEIKSTLEWFETTEEYAMQQSLQQPVARNRNADKFYRAFTRHSFGYAMTWYGHIGPGATVRKLYNAVTRRFKKKS